MNRKNDSKLLEEKRNLIGSFNDITEKINNSTDEAKTLRQMRRKVLNKYVQTIRCGRF